MDGNSHAALAVGLIAGLALLGNILITIVGLRLPAHPKNLTQVFLISLSVADILLSVQVPFYILGLLDHMQRPEEDGHTQTMDVLCNISSFVAWMAIKANIFMVMVMGVDRMVATCYAATYLNKVRREYALTACAVVWVVSFVLAGLPGIFVLVAGVDGDTNNPYSYDENFRTCTPIPDFCQDDRPTLKVYFILEMVVTVFLPLCIILFCYIRICSKIFDLKKIRTISRHFSHRQIFKRSSRAGKVEEGFKQSIRKLHRNSSGGTTEANTSRLGGETVVVPETPTPVLGPLLTGGVIKAPDEDPLAEEVERPFRLNLGRAETDRIYPEVEVERPFRLTTLGKAENSIRFPAEEVEEEGPSGRVNFNRAQSAVGFRIGAVPPVEDEPCAERNNDPPTSAIDPPVFEVDPSLQRKRFNFFTIDTRLEECPEVQPGRRGIISSSIGVIEKHYNAIESARDELAKKMRVYKYQIRVARTAVVVCTFFVICYIIFETAVILVLSEDFCRATRQTTKSFRTHYVSYSHLMLFINSALNVLIYGLMHRSVRAQVSKIVCCNKARLGSNS